MALHNSWMSNKLVVKLSRTHDKGVFARRAISKGERVAIFGGDIIRIDEIPTLPPGLQRYTMQIEERFVLGHAVANRKIRTISITAAAPMLDSGAKYFSLRFGLSGQVKK